VKVLAAVFMVGSGGFAVSVIAVSSSAQRVAREKRWGADAGG